MHTLESTLYGLSSRQKNLSKALIDVDRRYQQCLKKIRQEKENIIKMVEIKFDVVIRETKAQREEAKSKIQNKTTLMEGNLALLNQMRQYVDNGTLTAEDVRNCQENLDSVKTQCNSIPTKLWRCEYVEFTGNEIKEALVEQLCGELTRKCFSLEENAQTCPVVPKFKRKRCITGWVPLIRTLLIRSST